MEVLLRSKSFGRTGTLNYCGKELETLAVSAKFEYYIALLVFGAGVYIAGVNQDWVFGTFLVATATFVMVVATFDKVVAAEGNIIKAVRGQTEPSVRITEEDARSHVPQEHPH